MDTYFELPMVDVADGSGVVMLAMGLGVQTNFRAHIQAKYRKAVFKTPKRRSMDLLQKS